MWQEGYLESLKPLPGALDGMGLSTQFLSMSLAPNNTKKWDHSFAANFSNSIPPLLEILEHTGFFVILGRFSNLLNGLHGTGLLPTADGWNPPPSGGGGRGVLENLSPFFKLLVHLSPWKIYHSFSGLRNFLEQVEDGDWEGPKCVKYLAFVQQGMEDLQPQKTLNCLEGLLDFLSFQQQNLAWLEFHPEVQQKLGHLNFFPTLAWIKNIMESGMEYFDDCLTDLQGLLEDLNKVEAIVPSPDDLDVF